MSVVQNSLKIKPEISADDFTNHPAVNLCLENLKQHFEKGNKPFIVSDVVDSQGNQYVNLVQKGGGVLGIALVGYTYILEKMGVRFLRLAGTSAGSINTALMAVIGKKPDEKSVYLLDSLCNLELFNLVDGPPIARWIIKKLVSNDNFGEKIKKFFSIIIIIGVILILSNFILLGFQYNLQNIAIYTLVSFIISAIYFSLIGLLVIYFTRVLKKVKNSGFGINPGNFFYDWIKDQLAANGVDTVSELTKKAEALPELFIRPGNPGTADTLFGDVTFIASELVTQNKIQFPAMCNLFREKKDIDTLPPAGFIRASMAIPLFFESYFIDNIPKDSSEIKEAWLATLDEPVPPSLARFVDGGILSNFPINLFYNPKLNVPRLPTFGIDLDNNRPGDNKKDPRGWTITGYLLRIFNTIRYYYDKDFLLKNKVYGKGIGKIYLPEYNWLNFFLSDQDKIKMFIKGAEAATKFLIKDFNWEDYKLARSVMQIKIDIETGKKVTLQKR